MKLLGPWLATAVLVCSSSHAQEVTLPLERYEELRARARPAPETPARPPTPFALESAEIEVNVGRQSARVAQRLTLSIYAQEWVRVPLPPLGSLTSIALGALEGRIENTSTMTLVARGRGRHQLRIHSVVPLKEDPAAARATRNVDLALPAAAAVTGTVVVPEDVQEVSFVSGGLSRGSPAPRRHDFVGRSGAKLELRLLGRGRVAERTRLPLKYNAVSYTVAELARTRTRLAGRVEFQIASGQAESLELELPRGFDVVSVMPSSVGWTLEGRRLVLTPPVPVADRLAVDVILTGEPQQDFRLPLLVPKGAARATLLAAVHVLADGIPELADPGSSRKAEPAELALVPEELRQAKAPFFLVRDPERAPRWTVQWSEGAEVLPAQIDRLVVNALVGSAGKAAYQLWAAVRSSGATELVFQLPPSLELLGVERDGVPIVPGTSEEGLTIPLGAGGEAQLVHLSGLLSGVVLPAEGEIAVPLPSTSAPIGRVEVAVRLPADSSYSLVNADRSGRVSQLPQPRAPILTGTGASQAAEAQSLGILSRGRGGIHRPQPVWFEAPPQSVLLEAAWSAVSSNLGPLSIRVKPPRERKEEWF